MAEPVAGQVGQAELRDDLVPVGRIANGRGREYPSLGPGEERIFGRLAVGEALQDGAERVEDRDAPFLAALGGFGDQAAAAGVNLAGDDHQVLAEVHVPGLQPGYLG